MSLRFMDSFDAYATVDLPKKWTANQTGTAGAITVGAANGRRSTNGARFTSATGTGGTECRLVLTLDDQPTWITGMALRFSALPTVDSLIAQWFDTSTTQVELWALTNGTLRATCNGAVLGTTTFALSAAAYYYVEWAVTIHASTGSVTIRVNADPKLTLTGINTQNTANAFANTLRWGCDTRWNNTQTLDLDDVYVCDGTGAAPLNTFLGDCRCDGMTPNGDTGFAQWTPSAGTVHWDLVNDPAPNVTDYISSSTVGQLDVFQMQNVAVTPSLIYGMQLSACALKSDAGARSIKLLVSSNSVVATSAPLPLSTSQIYVRALQLTDPNTGGPWTPSTVNSALGGVECA
jgi:hypothetical protein